MREQRASRPDMTVMLSVPAPLQSNWCPHSKHVLAALHATPPGLVVDVGALDGTDAIRFAKTGHRTISFEPSPGKREPVLDRFRKSGLNITLVAMALSNITGSVPFHVNRAEHRKGQTFFRGALGSAQDGLGGASALERHKHETVVVPVGQLHDVITEPISYLKVDAQGFDFRVLLGARRLLATGRVGVLATELAPRLVPGGVAEAVEGIAFLDRVGYTCYGCEMRHSLPANREASSVSAEEIVRNLHRSGRWQDIVCFPRGRGVSHDGTHSTRPMRSES